MRTVKPQRLGVLHRTVEHADQFYFVPSVLVGFRFEEPDVPVHEAAVWKALASELGVEGGFDEAVHKKHCEVLVLGKAYPSKGREAVGCEVRLTLAEGDDRAAPLVDKRLYVVGDRTWDASGAMSAPEPFREMPIVYSRAFGGEGFGDNPFGRGFAPQGGVHELPNVEDPNAMIRSRDDRPAPAGFGPLDIRVPRRQKLAGTYDDTWFAEQYPGFPVDFDWAFFNIAPRDQWLPRDFRGGECFWLENMHPEHARQQGRCPQLRPRAFVTKTDNGELQEVPLRFDTLWLVPGAGLGVAIYRGSMRVREDDATDIQDLVVAAEGPDHPKPIEHYVDCYRRRSDGNLRGLHALADDELLPPLPEGADPMGLSDLGGELEELLGGPNMMMVHQHAKAQRELDAQRSALEEAGGEVPDDMPKELPPLPQAMPSPDEIQAEMDKAEAEAAAAQKEADAQRDAFEQQLREQLAAEGRDYDEVMLEARRQAAGPPSFDPEAEYQRLVELQQLSENAGVPLPEVSAQLSDDKLLLRLKKQRAQLVQSYRDNAHYMVAAVPMRPEDAEAARAQVREARDAGASLDGRDFTGADLSGMDLSGMSLSGAFLEAANLSGSILTGADLSDAVLVRANLTESVLSEARCHRANFGDAELQGTDLSGADCTRAVFARTRLSDANLRGATVTDSLWLEAQIRGGDFSKLSARKLVALRLDLSDADFSDAELPELVLLECTAERTKFVGANLEAACLVGVQAKGSCFDRARATSLRIVHESQLEGASFRGAQLDKACLRGNNFQGACFDEATLTQADISEADLRRASLERVEAPSLMGIRADLRQASLYGSNLCEAILGKAHLGGADLSRANLFRADLFRIYTDGGTKLDGAHMKNIRFKERPDDPG